MERILVAVKQVGSLDDEFEFDADGRDVSPDFLTRDLNEWDDYALEEALRIRERAGSGVEVVAVTVAPGAADDDLRKCLAKGADRALRVWDDAFGDPDGLMVALVLAACVAREDARLVLTGVQSADHGSAATGPALAAALGWPMAAVVNAIEYLPGADSARVRRELEGGLEEAVAVPCPAVLAIQVGINTPRYASLRGIKLAAGKPIETPTLTDLGLDPVLLEARRGTRVRRMFVPPRAQASMIEGTPAEQAQRLAELVRAVCGGAP